MENVAVTANELALLEAIYNSEFHDGISGAGRIKNSVWLDCIWGFSGTPKFGGIMSSLSKKGLASSYEDVCWITALGYDVLQKYSKNLEN
jgi:hypothetical protein